MRDAAMSEYVERMVFRLTPRVNAALARGDHRVERRRLWACWVRSLIRLANATSVLRRSQGSWRALVSRTSRGVRGHR